MSFWDFVKTFGSAILFISLLFTLIWYAEMTERKHYCEDQIKYHQNNSSFTYVWTENNNCLLIVK